MLEELNLLDPLRLIWAQCQLSGANHYKTRWVKRKRTKSKTLFYFCAPEQMERYFYCWHQGVERDMVFIVNILKAGIWTPLYWNVYLSIFKCLQNQMFHKARSEENKKDAVFLNLRSSMLLGNWRFSGTSSFDLGTWDVFHTEHRMVSPGWLEILLSKENSVKIMWGSCYLLRDTKLTFWIMLK